MAIFIEEARLNTRLEKIFFRESTAPNARDIKVSFIPNESLSKTGFHLV